MRQRSDVAKRCQAPSSVYRCDNGSSRGLTQQVSQCAELFGRDAEVGPAAALFTLDESGVEQHLQVVADRRLGEPERLCEVTDARLALRLCLDETEESQARGICEDAEGASHCFRVLGGERAVEERRTGGGERFDQLHAWILTHVDLVARLARYRQPSMSEVGAEKMTKEQPEVLFVCVHNAGRSQMAAGFVTLRSGGRIHVRSAGSAPAEEVNPAVVQAMAEVGVDLSEAFPKPLTDEAVRAADVVITMGCGDACPIYPGKRYEDWQVDDPAGQDVEAVRVIRDEIDARVQRLVAEVLVG